MTTKTDTQKLSPQQETALDLLATGANVTATAEQVKVSRQTVSEWLNHHAAFQAALNMRRRELFTENQERLRSLIPKALETLEGSLGDERQGYCQLKQFSTKKATRYGHTTLISSRCRTQKCQILFNLTVPVLSLIHI